MIKIFFSVFILFLSGCSSSVPLDEGETTFSHDFTATEYKSLMETYTHHEERYDGFISTYEFSATILNSSVLDAQLMRKASDFKWTREQLFAEREKVAQSSGNQSQVFLGFYSPEGENNKLESNKSIWKIYLVSNGTRYEGKVTKTSGALAQFTRMYPSYSRFYTPYILTFNVPMVKIQQSESKLVLTGPIGTSEVTFPPSSQKP